MHLLGQQDGVDHRTPASQVGAGPQRVTAVVAGAHQQQHPPPVGAVEEVDERMCETDRCPLHEHAVGETGQQGLLGGSDLRGSVGAAHGLTLPVRFCTAFPQAPGTGWLPPAEPLTVEHMTTDNLGRKVKQLEHDVLEIYELLSGITTTQGQHSVQLAGLRGRLDEHTVQLTGLRGRLDEHTVLLEQLRAESMQHGSRLNGHDNRFDRIDQRFEQVDQRFEQVDQRFDKVDQSLDEILTLLRAS